MIANFIALLAKIILASYFVKQIIKIQEKTYDNKNQCQCKGVS